MAEIIRGPLQPRDDIPEGYLVVQLGAEVYGVPSEHSWRPDKPNDYDEYTRKFASFSLWLRWQFFLYLGKEGYRELCRPEGVRSWPIWPRAKPSQREIEDEMERLTDGHWWFGIKPGGEGSRLQFPGPSWAPRKHKPQLETRQQLIDEKSRQLEKHEQNWRKEECSKDRDQQYCRRGEEVEEEDAQNSTGMEKANHIVADHGVATTRQEELGSSEKKQIQKGLASDRSIPLRRRGRKHTSGQVMDVETQASYVDAQLKDVNDAKVIDVSLTPSQVSNSQAQDTEQRVGELEILLKTSEQKQQEFEEQLASAKAECRQYDAKLSELSLELEASLANASSLQAAVGDANGTVEFLKKSIHLLSEEKKAFEDASDAYGAKLSHVESLLELLQQELKMTQEKLITVESDFEIATQKEAETAMKLKLSEEYVDQQRVLMQESAAKCQELELLYEDANMKLQNEVEKFAQRDSAAKELLDKVNALEKEAAARQEQAVEASSCNQDLQAQLEEQLKTMISLENYCDELKSKVLESESQVSASSSENEILVETNLKIKEELKVYHEKVSQLETVFQALQTKKEATEEVKFHKNNIDDLTDKHARALQLYSDSESHIMDIEQKLREAIERCTLRAKKLNENMRSLETQLKTHEENAENAERVIESQKVEMEQVRSSLAHLEGTLEELQNRSRRLEAENEALAEANLELNEQISACQTEISELQVVLNTVQAEKDAVVEQLNACEKTINDLTEQQRAEGHKLQSQISSIMTESLSLSETYEKSRKEFQILRSELEDKLKGGKAREDAVLLEIGNLRAEVADRSSLLSRVGLLEQELALSEAQLKEQEEKICLINAELESSKIKTNQIAELEKKIEDLEIELQSARLNPEIQSRGIADLGVGASPSKGKSKKESEAAATQTVQGSPLMGFKLVVAVALISLIIGLLLGRGN